MSGRRKHSRVTFSSSHGVLRVSRDVVVELSPDNELVALSSEPGVPGEELTIASSGNDETETNAFRVTASRPVFVNGGVRHELRVEPADAHDALRDHFKI
jgi:hypothetical protein